MGCWNETCAVSGLPVLGGDKVMMVVFDKTVNDEKRKLSMEWLSMSGRFHLYGIFEGEYNTYGWIEEIEEDEKKMGERPDLTSLFVHKAVWEETVKAFDVPGTISRWRYDGRYGEIKSRFREDVMRFMIGEMGRKLDRMMHAIKNNLPLDYDEFKLPPGGDLELEGEEFERFFAMIPKSVVDWCKIVMIAFENRIDLFSGIGFKGSQCDGRDFRLRLADTMRTVVAEQRKEEEEWGDDGQPA